MSDFSLIGGGSNALEEGYDFTGTGGTTITAAGSTDTLGSFVELVSAANNISKTTEIQVICQTYATGPMNGAFLCNIAIGGAGSEQIIIPNLFCHTTNGSANLAINRFVFPISIPPGARISANCQAATASVAIDIHVILLSSSLSSASSLSSVDDIGANTGTTDGTTIQATTADTFGSWTEMISSTVEAYKGFLVCCFSNNNSWSNLEVTYQVGVGSAGNEEIIYSGHQVKQNTFEDGRNEVTPFIPVGIPKSTRIAIRAQSSIDNVDSDLDYIMYGVR